VVAVVVEWLRSVAEVEDLKKAQGNDSTIEAHSREVKRVRKTTRPAADERRIQQRK
jgi:hypothetical protein